MEKLLYAVLIAGLAWTIGGAAFGSYLHARLAMLTTKRARKLHRLRALAKGAFAVTSGILMYRLVLLGSTEPTFYAWVYIGGLFVAGYAFTGLAREAADDLAEVESDGAYGAARHRLEDAFPDECGEDEPVVEEGGEA